MKQNKKTNLIKSSPQLFALVMIISGFAISAFAEPPTNDNFASAEIVGGI